MAKILSDLFAEFCESQRHLDSLLSDLESSQKNKVARLMGVFLRRPWTLSRFFGIELAASPEEFWSLSFIRLKKHPGIHALFREMWARWEDLPREGASADFPPALVDSWRRDWGAESETALARLLSQDPLTTIRFHRSAFDGEGRLRPEIEVWLSGTTVPKSRTGNFMKSARIFRGYATVQKNEFFQGGCFEIQDEGSQLMAAFALSPEVAGNVLSAHPMTVKNTQPAVVFSEVLPSQVVIDACAGAGGKTLALSDLMGGKGRVFAYDTRESKIKGLGRRLERVRETNVKAIWIPPGQPDFLNSYRSSADVVLVDSPCSGLGVLRRNPDLKWNRKPLEAARRADDRPLEVLQEEILSGYAELVKPGGRLVYGVCTFNRSETTAQVERLMNRNPSFRLEKEGFVGPYDTDGFYMASLQRE